MRAVSVSAARLGVILVFTRLGVVFVLIVVTRTASVAIRTRWGSGLARILGEEVGSILQGSLDVELVAGQITGSTGTESYAFDVLRHREIILTISSLLGLQTDGEDGQVIDFHCKTLEHQLLDALHHVGEQTLGGTGRETRIVFGHVLSESVEIDGLSYYWAGIVLAIRLLNFRVLVFR